MLIRTQQHEGKEVSACSLIRITASQALSLALLLVPSQAWLKDLLMQRGSLIQINWIWKAISIKSLGPFSDLHMLPSNQQTIYVTLRCSIVLAPLARKVPPSYVQRVAAWSVQDPILLSDCLTLRRCETKVLWMPAIVTLLPSPHLGRDEFMIFLHKKRIKLSLLAILALFNFHVPKGA